MWASILLAQNKDTIKWWTPSMINENIDFKWLIQKKTFLIFAVYDHGIAICGPEDWKNVSVHCVGDTQSPINIKTDQISVEIYPYPNAYRFNGDNTVGGVSGVLANNGHAPTLIVDQVKTLATFIGGPWGAHTPYKLQQINFHFGCDAWTCCGRHGIFWRGTRI